jgi:hypothetical protein
VSNITSIAFSSIMALQTLIVQEISKEELSVKQECGWNKMACFRNSQECEVRYFSPISSHHLQSCLILNVVYLSCFSPEFRLVSHLSDVVHPWFLCSWTIFNIKFTSIYHYWELIIQ